jgi:hypothetical protein
MNQPGCFAQGGSTVACRIGRFVAGLHIFEELVMKAPVTTRALFAVGTFAVITALGACAVTTAPFSPTRATVSNRSMTSHYDVLRNQRATGGIGKISSTADGGLFDFRYY